MAKVDTILDEIKGLTLLEASELVKKMEEAFGVSAAAATVVAAGGGGGGGGGGAGPGGEKKGFSRGAPQENRKGAGRGRGENSGGAGSFKKKKRAIEEG